MTDEEKLARLSTLLEEASVLAREIGDDHLPLALAGAGYIEWEQLHWMAESISGAKGESDG